jgi:CO/xanthine dehydrogenase FAD-binding subunit
VKPPRFEYVAPDSLDEVVSTLDEYGDEATILAGGQSLIPMMNFRLARPRVLVDVTHVHELRGIRHEDGDDVLAVGSTTTQGAVERAADVARHAPMIVDALQHVGHAAIRNRGTLGGNIAHADPASEMPAVLMALGGEVVARSTAGERVISADDLFDTSFTTALEENEVLTEVRVPALKDHTRCAFLEFARRHGDFALVAVAAVASVEGGKVKSARIALAGVGDAPVRAVDAERVLVGADVGAASVADEAGQAAAAAIQPLSDFHASGDYRKQAAATLVKRAVAQMLSREGMG